MKPEEKLFEVHQKVKNLLLDKPDFQSFYFHLTVAAFNGFDEYEIFLTDFASFKKKIKNDPNKIKFYLTNTNKYDQQKLFLL